MPEAGTGPRPWVRVKVAASADGRTALPDGRSQWITSPAARLDGHRLRAEADALLTGSGTVLQDDPQLNIRLPGRDPRYPPLAIVDGRDRVGPAARALQAVRPVWLYSQTPAPVRAAEPPFPGLPHVRRIAMPDAGGSAVDLPGLLADLHARGVRRLHVEAGARLHGALLRQRLVDELVLYLAPKLLGQGLPLADLGLLPDLDAAIALEFQDVAVLGPDLRIRARPR